MKQDNGRRLGFAKLVVLAAALAVPLSSLAGVTWAVAETAIVPEKNPPGDIPDSQVFVGYAGNGVALQVPEGWARSDIAGGAVFADKLDGVSVVVAAGEAPTLASVKGGYVAQMKVAGRAVEVSAVTAVDLPGGKAILIVYGANSEPNAVTNKQVRQEANRYLFFQAGKVAVLDLYAPAGADNVDQWTLMSRSFQWK